MLITFELPDEDARRLQAAGVDLAQRAKEALLADLHKGNESNHGPDGLDRESRRPNPTRHFWKSLDPETLERFATHGISEADFEAAAQGITPLPKSEADRKLAESIREAKNTEPNVLVRRADIIFVSCGDVQVPTLRRFIPVELADKMVEEWLREKRADPPAFLRRMEGFHQKAGAVFRDLTSRKGAGGGEALGEDHEKTAAKIEAAHVVSRSKIEVRAARCTEGYRCRYLRRISSVV